MFSQRRFCSFKSSGARYSVPLSAIYPATQHKIPQCLNIQNKCCYRLTNTKYSLKNLYLIIFRRNIPFVFKIQIHFLKITHIIEDRMKPGKIFRLMKPHSPLFILRTLQPINTAKGVNSPLYNMLLQYELIKKVLKIVDTTRLDNKMPALLCLTC